MTTENWLTIATIIATLIASVIPVWLQSRLQRPRPTPTIKIPKNRTKSGRNWTKYFGGIVILLNLVDLVYQLRSAEPLTRWGVFSIVLPVASILFYVFALALLALIAVLQQAAENFADGIKPV